MADLGASVLVSAAELRMVNLEDLGFWEGRVLGKEKKGESDGWSVMVFGGKREVVR